VGKFPKQVNSLDFFGFSDEKCLQTKAKPDIIPKKRTVQKGRPYWTIVIFSALATACIHAPSERMLTYPYRIAPVLAPKAVAFSPTA